MFILFMTQCYVFTWEVFDIALRMLVQHFFLSIFILDASNAGQTFFDASNASNSDEELEEEGGYSKPSRSRSRFLLAW